MPLQCLEAQRDLLGACALVVQIDQTVKGHAAAGDAQNAVGVLPQGGRVGFHAGQRCGYRIFL